MLVSFSIFPTDKGASVSAAVASAVKIIRASGLSYQLTAMSTLIEGEPDAVWAVMKECHLEMRRASKRVYAVITIDDRRGAQGAMDSKVSSIEEKLR